MATVNNRTAREKIASRDEFKNHTGSLSGKWVKNGESFNRGELPKDFTLLLEIRVVKEDTFIVFSYFTPIAWWSEKKGWLIPDVKYSVTTSKQQSMVKLAANA